MKHLLSILFSFNSIFILSAQVVQPFDTWQAITENSLPDTNQERWIIPQRYQTFQLDKTRLFSDFQQVPLEGNNAGKAKVVTIPFPNGTTQSLAIVSAPVMHPDLAAKYPQITTYKGVGVTDPTAKIYLDITPNGFHGMVLSEAGTVFIDPYYRNNDNYYLSYFKRDFIEKNPVPFSCDVLEEDNGKLITDDSPINNATLAK